MKYSDLVNDLIALSDRIEKETDIARSARGSGDSAFREQADLELALGRLASNLHKLLPPRPAASALSCPHCGKNIGVSLSK
jgi:hypothetical protein